MSFSLTLSHCGIFVTDLLECDARALPGFKSRVAWMSEIEQKLKDATARRRRAAAPATA